MQNTPVTAIAGAILADNKQYYMHEVVGGLGGFGIFAGLLIGHVHGGINLVLIRGPDPNRGPDGETNPLPTGASIARIHDDGNPYAPPTHH